MVHSKFSAVGFALSLSLTTVAQIPAQAQTFKLPSSVAQGTSLRVDGSSSMTAVNQVLKQQFEKKYSGTQVNLANNGTPQGIQALLDGKVDVAAIGRPLNKEEKAKGLAAVPVGRDKIAILVGSNNPFTKSLNINQFARIFRGEIKNWSEVGGPSAPIRFVDRPDGSDTRQAFRSYPVFKQGNFAAGSTAEKLNDDSTDAVVKKLGTDGISYSTVNQIKNQPNAKAVIMHGTPPTDARYPFSQPLYYVYKADKASDPKLQAFLGFATNAPGQKAIEQAGVAESVETAAKADAKAGENKTDGVTTAMKDNKAGTEGRDQIGASSTNAVKGEGAGGGDKSGGLFGFLPSMGTDAPGGEVGGGGLPNWLWWLFPIGSGAALLWLLGKGRRQAAPIGGADATGSFVPPSGGGEYNYRGDVDLPEGRLPNVEGRLPNGLPNVGGAIDNTVKGTTNWVGETTQNGVDFVGDTAQSASNLAGDAARAGGNLFNNTGAVIAGGAAAAAGTGAAAWAAFGGRNGKQTRVVLKARSPEEIEAFWDIPPEQRDAVREAGGEKLALRLYDVTDIDLERQPAHSVQQFDCDELTHRQRLPIGLSDRDYLAELGYLTPDQQWLSLGRSSHVRVPPSSSVVGDIAKAGGAAIAGGVAAVGGVADSAKSFLERDRNGTEETDVWNAEHPQTPDDDNFFERMGRRATDTASNATQAGGAAIAGGAAAATGAGAAAWNFLSGKRNHDAAAAHPATRVDSDDAVSDGRWNDGVSVDADAGRIVLTPRNGQWAYAYWDVPRSSRALTNREADHNLVLRLYDVTTNVEGSLPERYEQFDVDDLALSCDVPIPASNRSYLVELGYVDSQNRWTRLARSASVWVPAT
jgi:phosphate transport system substrate-binding protein